MAAVAPTNLLSDHINYLIFRYLQEHGHITTANAFYNDWYRPQEYRDPEEFPFANSVTRAALVRVVQDGLKYDDMYVQTAANVRRHAWSQLSQRHSFSQAKSIGAEGAKRKSFGTSSHLIEDGHPPVPKRQRTLPEESRVNGHRDPMEIDDRSPSAPEDDEDGDIVSPAVSEPEAPPTRYDSVATQTDTAPSNKSVRPDLKARALRFAVDKPGSKLFHAAWNPSKHFKHRRTLVTTGEGLCRLYQLPERLLEDVSIVPHVDEPSIASDSMITALAWHPSGRVVTCAVNTKRKPDGPGRGGTMRTLIDIGPDVGGTVLHSEDSFLLQPPGVVLAIEYSPSGEHLLVASTNTNRSLVEIWATPVNGLSHTPRTDPIAWCFFDQELTDVAWCEDLQIRACTAGNQAAILMLPPHLEAVAEFTADSIKKHNLIEEELRLPFDSSESTVTYRYDSSHWLDLYFVQSATGTATDKMIVIDLKHHDASNSDYRPMIFEMQQDFTTAALQPVPPENTTGEVKSPSSSNRLLAVAFESGDCQVYELGRLNDQMVCKVLTPGNGQPLRISQGPLLAAAWSPDARYLALAGDDLVQIWDAERVSSGLSEDDQPLLTWRGAADEIDGTEQVNGVTHDHHVAISWDALSEKICFVVDNKISIIELQQTTAPGVEQALVNGV